VKKFAEILGGGGDGAARAAELGELMYKSHKSYSACSLGSPGTDELVRLVREAGAGAGLYGAKITGGGSGGTVAVMVAAEAGRELSDEAAAALERVGAEYARATGRPPRLIAGSQPGAELMRPARVRW
jgi:L-arabinokinase